MYAQTITTTDVQRRFSQILDDLTDPIIVMRDSKPEAVVVDYDEYLELKKDQKKVEFAEFESLLDSVHAKNAHIPVKVMEKDIEEAFKYVRSHRRHKHLR